VWRLRQGELRPRGAGLAVGRIPRDLERVAERLARRRARDRAPQGGLRAVLGAGGGGDRTRRGEYRLQGLGVALGGLRPRAPDEDTASQEDTRRGGAGGGVRGRRGGF